LKTKTSEEKEHSEFGGSQAERIMNCPASVALSRGIPNKDSDAGKQGTTAHSCLEFFILNRALLKNKVTRQQVLKKADESSTIIKSTGEVIFWDQDMIDHALDTLTYIESQIQPGGTLYAEQKLDSSKFTTKDQKSTLDVCIVNWAAREIIVMDYKYGKSPVKVIKNDQIIYYAIAMLIQLKAWGRIDRVRCVIAQPRVYDEPQEWTCSVDYAVNWARRFKAAVQVALKPNAPFKYGDKYCFFCLAKKKCPVMKERTAAKDFK
jgi:hypothetical protein